MTKNNEQMIIDDLKEMIYKLQIECAEKTDNILVLGEKLHSKEQECEELKKQNDCNCLDSCCKKQQFDQLKKENVELKEELKLEKDLNKDLLKEYWEEKKSLTDANARLIKGLMIHKEKYAELKKEIEALKKLLKEENCHFDKIKEITGEM